MKVEMKYLHRILVLFICFLSIKSTEAVVNLKLTSIYYGQQGFDMDQVHSVALWTGRRQAVVVLFTDWCPGSMKNLFDLQLNHIWTNQSIPLITWQITGCNGKKQPGVMKLIHTNHTFDSYIYEFAIRLRQWLAGNDGIYGNDDDRRAYLRLAHEMNGDWYSWSIGSTPTDYVLSWQHIHHILTTNQSLDSTRLQWIWCVNNADVGNYTAEEYWVGDNYTNWLGIDGYNFGRSQNWSSWTWPIHVYPHMLGRLRNLSSTKPIAINEYACSSIDRNHSSMIDYKLEWLNQFCNYINNNSIQMASYFNKDKETDWAIFGGIRGDMIWNNQNVYSAYKTCLQTDYWIEPNLTNPRLITDEQFAGFLTNL